MDYNYLEKLIAGRETPLAGTNEDGEHVIVIKGTNANGNYIETQTLQPNGWTRINTYYECGDTEETYKK